jgi:hypothetical protein
MEYTGTNITVPEHYSLWLSQYFIILQLRNHSFIVKSELCIFIFICIVSRNIHSRFDPQVYVYRYENTTESFNQF